MTPKRPLKSRLLSLLRETALTLGVLLILPFLLVLMLSLFLFPILALLLILLILLFLWSRSLLLALSNHFLSSLRRR